MYKLFTFVQQQQLFVAMAAREHGNILTVAVDRRTIIVHQLNCVTTCGKGLSSSIFTHFPYADAYSHRVPKDGRSTTIAAESSWSTPGTIEVFEAKHNDGPIVVGVYAQHWPGRARRRFDTEIDREDWFCACLEQLREFVRTNDDVTDIVFPHGIGCGLAGGSWSHYEQYIDTFAKSVYEDDSKKRVRIVRLTRII